MKKININETYQKLLNKLLFENKASERQNLINQKTAINNAASALQDSLIKIFENKKIFNQYKSNDVQDNFKILVSGLIKTCAFLLTNAEEKINNLTNQIKISQGSESDQNDAAEEDDNEQDKSEWDRDYNNDYVNDDDLFKDQDERELKITWKRLQEDTISNNEQEINDYIEGKELPDKSDLEKLNNKNLKTFMLNFYEKNKAFQKIKGALNLFKKLDFGVVSTYVYENEEDKKKKIVIFRKTAAAYQYLLNELRDPNSEIFSTNNDNFNNKKMEYLKTYVYLNLHKWEQYIKDIDFDDFFDNLFQSDQQHSQKTISKHQNNNLYRDFLRKVKGINFEDENVSDLDVLEKVLNDYGDNSSKDDDINNIFWENLKENLLKISDLTKQEKEYVEKLSKENPDLTNRLINQKIWEICGKSEELKRTPFYKFLDKYVEVKNYYLYLKDKKSNISPNYKLSKNKNINNKIEEIKNKTDEIIISLSPDLQDRFKKLTLIDISRNGNFWKDSDYYTYSLPFSVIYGYYDAFYINLKRAVVEFKNNEVETAYNFIENRKNYIHYLTLLNFVISQYKILSNLFHIELKNKESIEQQFFNIVKKIKKEKKENKDIKDYLSKENVNIFSNIQRKYNSKYYHSHNRFNNEIKEYLDFFEKEMNDFYKDQKIDEDEVLDKNNINKYYYFLNQSELFKNDDVLKQLYSIISNMINNENKVDQYITEKNDKIINHINKKYIKNKYDDNKTIKLIIKKFVMYYKTKRIRENYERKIATGSANESINLLFLNVANRILKESNENNQQNLQKIENIDINDSIIEMLYVFNKFSTFFQKVNKVLESVYALKFNNNDQNIKKDNFKNNVVKPTPAVVEPTPAVVEHTSTQTSEENKKKTKILVIGDSQIGGNPKAVNNMGNGPVGKALKEKYVDQIIFIAKDGGTPKGFTTSMGGNYQHAIELFKKIEENQDIEKIIIQLGCNQINSGNGVKTLITEINAAFNSKKKPNIIWSGAFPTEPNKKYTNGTTPNTSDDIKKQTNEKIKNALTSFNNVTFIDPFEKKPFTEQDFTGFTTDGLHLTIDAAKSYVNKNL